MCASQPQEAGTAASRARIGTKVWFALLLLSVVVIVLVWGFLPVKYRAEGKVFVEPPYPKWPMESASAPPPPEAIDRFVAEQVVLIQDEATLREALRDASPRGTAWFRSHADEFAALAELQKHLSVRRLPDTQFLEVCFATPEPKDAPVVVNAVIQEYLARVKNAALEQYNVELQDYEQTRSRLEESLKRIRHEKETFVTTELGVPGVTEGINIVADTWRMLAEEVTRLESEKLRQQAALENLTSSNADRQTVSAELRLQVEQDPQVMRLQEKRFAIELELAGNPQTQPADPLASRLQRQLVWIDQKLVDLIAERTELLRDQQLQAVRQRYLDATQAELQLRERMVEAEAKQRDLDRGLARYRSLEEEQTQIERQLSRVADCTNQLRTMINARGIVRVRPVGEASPGTLDYGPPVLITGVAVLVPLAFGLLLLLFRAVKCHEPARARVDLR